MKKKILAFGAISVVIAPIATMISCGKEGGIKHFNLLPTYTGQADQLIALGIGSDYYPLQLNETKPYDYLLEPSKFMVAQSEDFKTKFAKRIKQLMPKTKGASWWNQQALDSDEQGSEPAYWQKMEGSLLLYEHYLLDDDAKIIDNSIAPKHKNEAVIQTNFRSSRDPYTRIPKAVFYGWDLADDKLNHIINNNNPEVVTLNHQAVNVTKTDAKIIKELKSLKINNKGESSWTYNDKYFVDTFHRMFLDNSDFQSSEFVNWLVDSTTESPFASKADGSNASTLSNQIQNLFDASTFRKVEVKAGIGPHSTKGAPGPSHHPIYEQQEGEIGAAPMFEGAMRDNQLYLFNVAWQLDNLVTYGTPYGQQHLSQLPNNIDLNKRDKNLKMAQSKAEAKKVEEYLQKNLSKKQVDSIKEAFENAKQITKELWQRIANLKTYFEALKTEVEQTTPLTFGLLTIAPGYGESTLQTMSKYSFIYRDLGFAQPVPTNIATLESGAKKYLSRWTSNGENNFLNSDGKVKKSVDDEVKAAIGEGSLFNMDDNGWFWTLGESGHLSTDNIDKFNQQFDIGVVASRDTDFDADIKNTTTNALPTAKMFKDFTSTNQDDAKTFLEKQRVNYDLWNEGLKTPFVMHMILDEIQIKMEEWAKNKKSTINLNEDKFNREDAISWGEYFTEDYIKNI